MGSCPPVSDFDRSSDDTPLLVSLAWAFGSSRRLGPFFSLRQLPVFPSKARPLIEAVIPPVAFEGQFDEWDSISALSSLNKA